SSINATPITAETTKNSRTGKYSASTHTSAPTAHQRSRRRSRRDDGKEDSANRPGVSRDGALNRVVPKRGLEPPRVSPLPPQGSASTNSATWARTPTLRPSRSPPARPRAARPLPPVQPAVHPPRQAPAH